MALTLNLTLLENTVTGTIESLRGAMQISSGSFRNGVLTVKTTMPIALTFVGEVSRNTMTGNVTALQGTTTFSGSRTP
ncbi:MAG: hypothetical protein LC768_05755 [Acidobacteria bacterium]|nr:hypothetical protein [Acidobacteriota bacterium]MCA1637828.1 hypothetical protein [Acidobacteriota bacterium]